jgi:hypothetical protein
VELFVLFFFPSLVFRACLPCARLHLYFILLPSSAFGVGSAVCSAVLKLLAAFAFCLIIIIDCCLVVVSFADTRASALHLQRETHTGSHSLKPQQQQGLCKSGKEPLTDAKEEEKKKKSEDTK